MAGGSLIQSLKDTDVFIPFVPELYLHYWLNRQMNEPPNANNLRAIGAARCLDSALSARWKFSPQMFERVVMHWERAMRYVRYSSKELGGAKVNIQLKELYKDGWIATTMPQNLKELKVDVSIPLECSSFAVLGDLDALNPNCMYVPESEQNPHFDFIEVVGLARGKKLFVFHQIKYSRVDASTRLDLKTIQTCYDGCMLIAHACEFSIVIIHGWRECWNTVQPDALPPKCVVINRDCLRARLGPCFSNFMDWQTQTPIFVQIQQ